MENYFLYNYNLTWGETFQSLLLSEYGLRHRTYASFTHRIIAAIELCPILGALASLIEYVAANLYRSFSLLFQGSQEECHGAVPIDKVEKVRAYLDNRKVPGIRFNPDKVAATLEGGACTAMVIDFVRTYLNKKQSIKQMGNKFLICTPQRKILQAAYNTIEVTDRTLDHGKNKIQALANSNFLKVGCTSQELGENDRPPLEKLPEGIYLVRILMPMENEKLEKEGHSLAYIKEKEYAILYDPNVGARQFSLEEQTSGVHNAIRKCCRQFNLKVTRFYQLEAALN